MKLISQGKNARLKCIAWRWLRKSRRMEKWLRVKKQI